MRISTAEIKLMILDCVKTPGMYTGADFSEYIRLNSDKDFTRGQISGALAQLVDTKDIIRVERALYAKDAKSAKAISRIASNNEKEKTMKNKIYNMLSQVEKEIAETIGSLNIWELSGENFEIIAKIRELKVSIEDIKNQCK